MKKTIFVALTLLFNSCLNQKVAKEFEAKKPEVILVVDPAKIVVKKTGITIVFPEYITNAPPDSALLKIFNQYLFYRLDELGYTALVIKDKNFNPDLIRQSSLVYEADMQELKVREFKKREQVNDASGTSSKTVKLRGLEISSEGFVRYLKDSLNMKGMQRTAKGSASKEESQEGQFKQTTGIKDLVKGNTNGSVKYLYTINHLEDGIFQNLLIDAAYFTAADIDNSIKLIYQKQKKAGRKKKS